MPQRKLYLGPLTDSRRWDHIALREDDVIVVTPPKSGTTWMQTIIALLLSGDPEVEPDLATRSPWVDIRFREVGELAARLEAMQHRRQVKSHTPLDGLPLHPRAQYICVFRHPLDAHLSFRAFMQAMPLPFFTHWYPKEDSERIAFRRFLDGGAEGFDGDANTLAHMLRHYEAARAAAAAQPNVALFHYADMCADLPATFARVAELLGVAHPPALMERLIAAARFDHMKAHAARYTPLANKAAMPSEAHFFDSGTSGKWQRRLTPEELAQYDAAMSAALSPDARAWLEFGAGTPPAR